MLCDRAENLYKRTHSALSWSMLSLFATATTILFSRLKNSRPTTLILSLLFLTTPVVSGKLLISYFVADLHYLCLLPHHSPHLLRVLLPSLLTKYPNFVYLLVLSLLRRLLIHLRHQPYLLVSLLSSLPLKLKSQRSFSTFLTNNLILISSQPGFLRNVLQSLFPLSLI